MRNRKIIKYLFTILMPLFILFSSFIGYSAFFIETSFSYSGNYGLSKETNEPIAYNGKTKKEYTTLDRAIEDANAHETVFVIPGSRFTLTNDCTIKENVTLCLPFEGEVWNGRQENAESTNTWRSDIFQEKGQQNFADGNDELVNTYLKSQVTIHSRVKLTNYGNIYIGGVLGIESQKLAGATSGPYCEIVFETSAILENRRTGTIKCMGYLKESEKNNNSQIINYEGSKFECPMVFYDYKGGNYTASAYGNEISKIFPCAQYDFPNNQIATKFFYGSLFNAYVDLYTNQVEKTVEIGEWITIKVTVTIHARHNVDDLNIIGTSNSLFELSENSSLIIKYTPLNDQRYSTYSSAGDNRTGSAGTTTININGNVNFSSFSLSLHAAEDTEIKASGIFDVDISFLKGLIEQYLNQDINTDTIDFPIPWNFSISVDQGSLNINDRVKFLGGSSLYIAEGANLNVNSKIIFYDDSITDLYSDTAYGGTIYPLEKGPASLVIDGSLNINDGAAFGAKISSNSANSIINVSQSATLSTDSHEGSGDYSISGTTINFSFSDYPGKKKKKSANVDLLDSSTNTITNNYILQANTLYQSVMFEDKIVFQKI